MKNSATAIRKTETIYVSKMNEILIHDFFLPRSSAIVDGARPNAMSPSIIIKCRTVRGQMYANEGKV